MGRRGRDGTGQDGGWDTADGDGGRENKNRKEKKKKTKNKCLNSMKS